MLVASKSLGLAERIFVATLWISFVFAMPVRAQESSDTERMGRQHFRLGAEHYESGDFDEALVEFQRSFELTGRAELFYNYSLCHQNLGNLERAAHYLERFLGEAENVPSRSEMERRLDNLRAEISARGGGSRWTRPGTLTGIAILGSGVVMASTLGGLALAERGRVREQSCGISATCTDSELSRMRRLALAADIGIGLAAVGLTVGLVSLLRKNREPRTEALRVTPAVSRHGSTLTLSTDF